MDHDPHEDPLRAYQRIWLLREPHESPPRFSVAPAVIWFPLLVAIVVGGAMWSALPPWFTMAATAPAVVVATATRALPPVGRRSFLATISVTAAAIVVGAFGLLAADVGGREMPAIVLTCGASASLGVLVGLWLSRGQRGHRAGQ